MIPQYEWMFRVLILGVVLWFGFKCRFWVFGVGFVHVRLVSCGASCGFLGKNPGTGPGLLRERVKGSLHGFGPCFKNQRRVFMGFHVVWIGGMFGLLTTVIYCHYLFWCRPVTLT